MYVTIQSVMVLTGLNPSVGHGSHWLKPKNNFCVCCSLREIGAGRTREEIYLVFTEKSNFSFYFIQYTGIYLFTKQAVKMRKPKIFENTNNFGTTLFLTF